MCIAFSYSFWIFLCGNFAAFRITGRLYVLLLSVRALVSFGRLTLLPKWISGMGCFLEWLQSLTLKLNSFVECAFDKLRTHYSLIVCCACLLFFLSVSFSSFLICLSLVVLNSCSYSCFKCALLLFTVFSSSVLWTCFFPFLVPCWFVQSVDCSSYPFPH